MNSEDSKPRVKWFSTKTIKTDKVPRRTFYILSKEIYQRLVQNFCCQGILSGWQLAQMKRPWPMSGQSFLNVRHTISSIMIVAVEQTSKDDTHSTVSYFKRLLKSWETVRVMLVSAHRTNRRRKPRTDADQRRDER